MMKDDDFKLLRGFADRLTDRWTDICDRQTDGQMDGHLGL